MKQFSNNQNNQYGSGRAYMDITNRRVSDVLKRDGYMSLQIIAKGYDLNPLWAFNRWLSEPVTLEFIQLWELLHNPHFNNDAFLSVSHNALKNGCAPSLEELKNDCRLHCIYVDFAFPEEVYLHKDIACDFVSWVSPAFRAYCLHYLGGGSPNQTLQFKSEEDFIISRISVAKCYKNSAFKSYVNEVKKCNLLSNDVAEYKYHIKGKIDIE